MTAFAALLAASATLLCASPALAGTGAGSLALPDFASISGAATTIDSVQLGGSAEIFVFAKAGETVALAMAETRDLVPENVSRRGVIRVTDPAGVETYSHTMDGSSGATFGGTWSSTTTGVWIVSLDEGASADGGPLSLRVEWNVAVLSDATTAIPGRVFAEAWILSQGTHSRMDHEFTAVNVDGAQYAVGIGDFNGVESILQMNNIGNAYAGTSTPAFRSVPQRRSPEPGGKEYWQPRTTSDHPDVRPYRLFLERPARDLPGSVTEWADARTEDRWLTPPYVPAAIADLSYSRADARGNAGRLLGSTSVGGQLRVEIDVDGNGSFIDEIDVDGVVHVPAGGEFSYAWDGTDSAGVMVPTDREGVSFRATLERVSPIHFLRNDVENSTGGLSITQLVGPTVGSDALSWDDSGLVSASDGRYSRTTPIAANAVSSSGGIHGWAGDDTAARTPNANNGIGGSWGDYRAMDDWAFLPERAEATATLDAVPPTDLRIEKSATGDPVIGSEGRTATLSWRLTAGNLGAGTAHDVIVSDEYPASIDPTTVRVIAPPTMGTFDPVSARWTIGTMPPGSSDSLIVEATVGIDSSIPSTVRNTAFIDSPDDPRVEGPICQPNDDLAGDTDQCDVVDTPVVPRPDLRIDKSLAAAPHIDHRAGAATIAWTIEVGNLGGGSARDVVVTDAYPAGVVPEAVVIVSEPSVGSFDRGSGQWAVGRLAPQQTATMTIAATLPVGQTGSVINRATVDSPDDPLAESPECVQNDGLTDDTDQCDIVTVSVADGPAPPVSSLAVTGGSDSALVWIISGGAILLATGAMTYGIAQRRRRV